MTISILHISDLHCDSVNSTRNRVLLDSLERDRDRYTSQESPHIKSPDLIIVSGDIIQGVKHETLCAEANLRKQYDVALSFLNSLTDRFADGNKQLIVIIPGNHDVSDYHFRQSLEPIDISSSAKRELVTQLFTPESRLRWSWSDFALYDIVNSEMYEQRFAAFSDFYNKFYNGVRSFPTDPAKQFDIFDFYEF